MPAAGTGRHAGRKVQPVLGMIRAPHARNPCMHAAPLELDIADLSHEGLGIGRHQNKVCFVPGALAGERVRVAVTRRSRDADEAQLLEVLQASPDRVTAACPHFTQCSGCSLQHLHSEAQIRFKQKQLADALQRIGQVQPQRWLAPLSRSTWGYRRKARLSVRYVEKKQRVLVGFREARAQFVADLEQCPVLQPALGTQLSTIATVLSGLRARREIPQLEACFGDAGWALVVRHTVALHASDRALLSALGQQLGCSLWLQPAGPDQLERLYDSGQPLDYHLPDADVRIAFQPLDFIQVNAEVNRAMVAQALDLLDPKPGELILDLYCGLGNFTLPIARRGASVIGVEGDAGLTRRAALNARANGLDGLADFHVADLSQNQRDADWASADYDRILLDPARAGAQAVFDYLPGPSVQRIVYVSCHPGTLARDAGLLCQRHGFKLVAAGVMDMFPHTAHVESMALFERA